MLIFHAKPSLINNWLSAKSQNKKTTYDNLQAYFSIESGLAEGTLYDHLVRALSLKGFTGSLRDMLNQYFTMKMGIADPRDAERAFFNDTTQDFDLTWGDMASRTWGGWSGQTWGDL